MKWLRNLFISKRRLFALAEKQSRLLDEMDLQYIYLQYDLEATRRERDYFRTELQRLENMLLGGD